MSKANDSFIPIEGSHFLYFCNGEACPRPFNCVFLDPEGTCCRTSKIEYAKNKEKYKKQILDGIFPVKDDWLEEGGNYIERG